MNPVPGEAEVTVVGAGPAGLAAAAAAGEAGRRVVVLDQAPRPGGQIWRHRDETVLPTAARTLLDRARRAGVVFMSGATVIDAPSSRELLLDVDGRVVTHQAGAIVLATGARERFLPFPGWTLPGVTGVGGLQALYKGGVDVRGARIVLAGTGPLLIAVAAAMASAGAHVLHVAEQARLRDLMRFGAVALRSASRLRDAVAHRRAFRGTPYHTSAWVTAAAGAERVRTVTLHTRSGSMSVECDWLGCAAGLVPVTDSAQLLGCLVHDGAIAVDGAQATSVDGIWAAGECTMVKGDAAAIAEGTIAGLAAAGHGGRLPRDVVRARDRGRSFGMLMASAFTLRPELLDLATDDTILCRCEDVDRGAVNARWSQRQAKLWTRVGMGACQGSVCGASCSALFGWEPNLVRAPLGAPACAPWQRGMAGSAGSATAPVVDP